jgi:MoxR-like ATPase/uncharacterized protein (DUF2164 family)
MANEIEKKMDEHGGKLESGTYDIIRDRLSQRGKELVERLGKLNETRKEVFGSIESTLMGSERIITRNNCIPRDMVPVGDKFIFGYNVHMGLKTRVEPSDVFAIYQYGEHKFREHNQDLIDDKRFLREFKELYKYYKQTRFSRLVILGPYLYMVFRVGKEAHDIKAFKWLIEEEGTLEYVDNRSDHEVTFPPSHDFEWVRTRREDHRYGMHPHVSIQDRVFVETVGGDLTIKVEDNTESGQGLYAEDVEDPDQTLDDSEIYYACVGHLVLLRILPYREKDYRYFVFNEKLQEVVRVDSIQDSCILLPDDHGIIFPNGYYLQSGQNKMFDIQLENMLFMQRIASSNGEDFQYTFYNRETGVYLILTYNLIAQEVTTPIVCNGYSHFENGEMLLFKTEDEPRKNHVIQIWQTPFVGKDYVTAGVSDSLLYKIGNQEIVLCMAQCSALINLIRKEDSFLNLYVDIEKESAGILDSYFWLDKAEAFNIKEVLQAIGATAASAVEEYEKVVRIKNATRKQILGAQQKTGELLKEIGYAAFNDIHRFVDALSGLRSVRGEIISLKDLRYTDLPLIESMEERVKEKNEELSGRCIEFLLEPQGLDPYREQVEDQDKRAPEVEKGSEGKALDEEISGTAGDLELLIEVVSNLKIDDPTQTTEIIDRISFIYSSLNQTKSKLQKRLKELRGVESEAEFNSQMKLIDQAAVNYLGVSDSVDKCDEYLNKLMVQIEELEGKFADFEEFVVQLTEKREELYDAFETRKLSLREKQDKKAAGLMKAAERIFNGLKNRLKSLKSVNEINGYFATDLMVEKVRDIVEQLMAQGDTVKSDDIQGRLKTLKEDAVRQLKDRMDLFVEGEDVIKFGIHLFNVNTQPLDLSTVERDGHLYFHINGTDFWQQVDSPELEELRDVWNQEAVSESPGVYRAEYLAFQVLSEAVAERTQPVEELLHLSEEELVEFVREFMGPRYREAYTKGLHDADAAEILKALMTMHQSIDLLVYGPSARALALLYWQKNPDKEAGKQIYTRLKSLNQVGQFFKGNESLNRFTGLVENQISAFVEDTGVFSLELAPEAAQYLCREVMRSDHFVMSAEAEEIYNDFTGQLKARKGDASFSKALKELAHDLHGGFYLVREWLRAYFEEFAEQQNGLNSHFEDEVAVRLLLNNYQPAHVIRTRTSQVLEGFHGDHAIIENGKYRLAYNAFMEKLRRFQEFAVPRYHRCQELKKSAVHEFRTRLRLDEFKTRVLSSFVRNKLIDKVYLPLIGDNMAKQLGTAGEGKRTDLMGLLLLISPPGYGKTTLMEYVANRLGITFVKVNGPAIGHAVTSLDPEEAPNAGAREEVKKLNLALEMGNNIMIYIDDIQHCNPEFLQKFISLCDAQRKIEGIYNGISRTYDLRGKKVAVVMAGNPYTESGEKFKIPDMLANRADVYNLGDMLRENEEAFKLSFLENCLTSNPVLNPLITRSQQDVYKLIDAAAASKRENLDLEGNYSPEEIEEYLAVIRKLLRVRQVVLDVNMMYIKSAAQSEEFRTEPPFKLQGSYRNMNRIAERILPVMNDDELESVIQLNYENDAQTLATGAEASLLKWKELVGRLKGGDKKRWDEIKSVYGKGKLVKGDDKAGQVVLQLSELGEGLGRIRDVISKGLEKQAKPAQAPPEVKVEDKADLLKGLSKGFESIKKAIDKGFSNLAKNLETAVPSVQPAPVPSAPPPVSSPASATSKASPSLHPQKPSTRKKGKKAPAGPVGTGDLDVIVENFNVVSPDLAKRLHSKARRLIQQPIDLEYEYRVSDISLESFGADRILLLTLECLKGVPKGLDEQMEVALFKSGKVVWESQLDYRGGEHIYKKGDIIFGRLKLDAKAFSTSDRLGIRILREGVDDQWNGLIVLGEHTTDEAGTRLLLSLLPGKEQ